MSRAWNSQRGFEVQDDAAVDAAGRQPAVRLGREPGRHDLGDLWGAKKFA